MEKRGGSVLLEKSCSIINGTLCINPDMDMDRNNSYQICKCDVEGPFIRCKDAKGKVIDTFSKDGFSRIQEYLSSFLEEYPSINFTNTRISPVFRNVLLPIERDILYDTVYNHNLRIHNA